MPLIIAATDFSDVANNALRYACDMAVAQNADVAVLHTYSLPLTLGDMTIPLPASDFRLEAEEGMSKVMAELQQDYPQILFKSAIIYGSIIDAVNEFLPNNEEPMLVIVGKGYSPENPMWLDSTLMEAFKNLQYPILAIPAETKYTQVRKIGFVYDNELGGSEHALQQLAQLTATIGAELHVHYNHDESADENEREINAGARGILAEVKPLYHYTHEKNTDDSILDFTAKYHLDWLVVLPRHHSFIENLFHKSHTKVIVNNSFIPVMALHESDFR